MRKLPSDLENPFDDVILTFLNKSGLERYMYNIGVTPNMITSVGNVFRILSIYYLFTGRKELFALLFVIGYVFDCIDGNFARKYNMCTKFGDWYDHISDTIFSILVAVYILFFSTLFSHSTTTITFTIFAYIAMIVLMTVHFSCQQKYINSEGQYLDMMKFSCGDKSWLSWTKYFGSGTIILFTIFIAWIF